MVLVAALKISPGSDQHTAINTLYCTAAHQVALQSRQHCPEWLIEHFAYLLVPGALPLLVIPFNIIRLRLLFLLLRKQTTTE